MSVSPVNPADFMQDIVIDEGTRRVPKTDIDKENAFKQMLAEEIFLKDVFSNKNSIYKPDPEEDENSVAAKGLTTMYGDYTKKQMAEYLVKQGFLDGVSSGRK